MEDHEEETTEDIVDHNNLMITALVDLLIAKGVISREELNAKADALEEAEETEETTDEPSLTS